MHACNLFWIFIASALATDTCYYPNGNVGDAADHMCPGGNGMCCPNSWECLKNGLCHNKAADIYGRYTCTDKSWSTGCPSMCTAHSPQGDEAVLQCDNGTWCCDYNRPQPGQGNTCCEQDELDRENFDFGDGSVFAVIGNVAAAASSSFLSTIAPASSTASASQTVSSSAAPTVIAGPPHATSRDPSTTSSSASGTISSAIGTAAQTSSTPSATSLDSGVTSSSARNLPMIIGLTIGVPIALALLGGIVTWLWMRRRARQSRHGERQATPYDFSQGAAEKHGPHTDGRPPLSSTEHKAGSTMAPSEIDSREIRVPISPQDTAHLSPDSANFPNGDTTGTRYLNTRPNSSNLTSPPPSATTSSFMSNAPDYSEWGVTPRMEQQRWSGTTALGSAGLGLHSPTSAASGRDMGMSGGEQAEPQELMGRPRIPSTIAELP